MCEGCKAHDGETHKAGCEYEVCPDSGRLLVKCSCSSCKAAGEKKDRIDQLEQSGQRIPYTAPLHA